MRHLFRALLVAMALFCGAVGAGFMIDPARLAGEFFLSPVGNQGLATLRADFPAFFITAGFFALYAAVTQRPGPLAVPVMLLVVALAGRGYSVLQEGMSDTAWPPMVVEAVMILIAAIAAKLFSDYQLELDE